MKNFLALSLLITVSSFINYPLVAQKDIPLKGDELFGAVRARQIGPALMSGRVSDIEVHPTDAKVFYVGAAGGGVWKTNNAGVTFNPIFDKHTQSIGCITLDPSAPDKVIWVGTGEVWTRNSVTIGDGIYKSTDEGQNWINMGLKNSERIASIVVNPDNSDEVFVAVLGALWGDSEHRGIYKTMDGGKTWDKIFYVNATTGCSELIMDPKNSQIMYAAFWEFRRTAYSFNSGGNNSALYKTTDGGKSWDKIHNGFPTGKLGRIAIAAAPSNPSILYTVLETEKSEDKGLYRSDDAGQSWKRLNGDFELVVRPFYFSRIVVDPRNPDIVLKAGLSGSISKDGGKTFRSIGAGVHSDFHDYAFDPINSNVIYVGTDGGVYRTWDGGTVWEMVRNLPLSQYYHVSYDNQKPYKVYGGLQDNGSWVGPSKQPGGIENRHWVSVGVGDGFKVYPHPENPNIVYSEMQGAENVWRVDLIKNQSKTIKPFAEAGDPKLRFNWNAPLNTSFHYPDRIYMGSQFLHISDDKGESWRKASKDLTTNDPKKQQQVDSGGLSADNSGAENHCTIFTINESPIDKDMIWIGTDDGNIQVTRDSGKSWKNVTPRLPNLPANLWVYHIAPSHFDKATAYIVLDGHTQSDMRAHLYKTTDFGTTWTSISSSDLPVFGRSILEDHKNPDLLFFGAEDGLYITLDGGKNWAKFENNMPAVAIHYLQLHPREDALIMATHGRGVIIIDDISPLRQISNEILSNEFVFLATKPTIINEGSGFNGYATVGEFVGDNPSSNAKITYYMGKRHTFGKMTMEVFDLNGIKVADLTPGKSKGINQVEWNYTLKRPKVAKGSTLAFGGFAAPTLPEGKYKVVVTKGSKTFESDIQLAYDTESIHSVDDRNTKYKAAMELYTLTENIASEVENLDAIQATAKQIDTKGDKNLAKKLNLTLLNKEIDDLRATMVVTTGDNYVGAAEPELREKVASLYSAVVGYAGRPTNAQTENAKLLNIRFLNSKTKIDLLVTKAIGLNAILEKAKIDTRFKVSSKEEDRP